MCDKKNIVLFTETECLILSPDFKILDESQVLLRIPRQNNMYNFDLKNVVPTRDLTCLFAKATLDESPSKIFENDYTCVACQKGKQHKASCKAKLVSSISQPLQILHMNLFGPTSVFFLATKDETSGILKIFITEIENQLNHKVKAIRPSEYLILKLEKLKSSDEKDGDDTANDVAGKNIVKEPASEDEQAMRDALDKMLNQEKDASEQSSAIIKEFEAECDRELLHRKTPRASSINSFNNVSTPINVANAFRGVNAASESGIFNAVGSSFVSLGGSFSIDATNLPDDPLMPDLEDTTEVQSTGIFGNAYDNDVLDNYNTPYADHVVGAEADFNNMEPSIVVSLIPTTRIHSIHPKDQIIGDPKSAVQTRGMTKKSSGEQAMISYILKQQKTNHKDYQNCLFACFLSQLEPKKVSQALDDESWVEAMQEELL
ncbi:hypothetical protein Tco_1433812 [Tanacetum coccineum]